MTPLAIHPIPTWSDVQEAINESYRAFEIYSAKYDAGQDVTEAWADYMSAVNHAASVGADWSHGNLMEAEICSL